MSATITWEPTRWGCNNCDAYGVLVESKTHYCAECYATIADSVVSA